MAYIISRPPVWTADDRPWEERSARPDGHCLRRQGDPGLQRITRPRPDHRSESARRQAGARGRDPRPAGRQPPPGRGCRPGGGGVRLARAPCPSTKACRLTGVWRRQLFRSCRSGCSGIHQSTLQPRMVSFAAAAAQWSRAVDGGAAMQLWTRRWLAVVRPPPPPPVAVPWMAGLAGRRQALLWCGALTVAVAPMTRAPTRRQTATIAACSRHAAGTR